MAYREAVLRPRAGTLVRDRVGFCFPAELVELCGQSSRLRSRYQDSHRSPSVLQSLAEPIAISVVQSETLVVKRSESPAADDTDGKSDGGK